MSVFRSRSSPSLSATRLPMLWVESRTRYSFLRSLPRLRPLRKRCSSSFSCSPKRSINWWMLCYRRPLCIVDRAWLLLRGRFQLAGVLPLFLPSLDAASLRMVLSRFDIYSEQIRSSSEPLEKLRSGATGEPIHRPSSELAGEDKDFSRL